MTTPYRKQGETVSLFDKWNAQLRKAGRTGKYQELNPGRVSEIDIDQFWEKLELGTREAHMTEISRDGQFASKNLEGKPQVDLYRKIHSMLSLAIYVERYHRRTLELLMADRCAMAVAGDLLKSRYL